MSVHPIHPGPPDQPGQQAADAQYYRGVLNDLINMGTGLARLLHQQATAQAAREAAALAQQAKHPRLALVPAPDAPNPAPDPTPAFPQHSLIDLAAAFDRIARAVRRSIALARTLSDPIPPASDPAQHRAGTRKRIIREVEDAIQRASDDAERHDEEGPDADALRTELRDRLDAPDLDDDVTTRPAAEIITEICRDLGIASNSGARPWKRRTPDDIRQLCARAAAPSRTPQPTATPQPGTAAAPHAPTNPTPANPTPIGPALIGPAPIPRPTSPANASPAHVGPVHAASNAPANAADLIATILRNPTYTRARWRPPPKT